MRKFKISFLKRTEILLKQMKKTIWWELSKHETSFSHELNPKIGKSNFLF
jgi:hypothetical protein